MISILSNIWAWLPGIAAIATIVGVAFAFVEYWRVTNHAPRLSLVPRHDPNQPKFLVADLVVHNSTDHAWLVRRFMVDGKAELDENFHFDDSNPPQSLITNNWNSIQFEVLPQQSSSIRLRLFRPKDHEGKAKVFVELERISGKSRWRPDDVSVRLGNVSDFHTEFENRRTVKLRRFISVSGSNVDRIEQGSRSSD